MERFFASSWGRMDMVQYDQSLVGKVKRRIHEGKIRCVGVLIVGAGKEFEQLSKRRKEAITTGAHSCDFR